MATIQFTGYLNEIKSLTGGLVIFRMGERQSKKNAQTGEWEIDGYTYYDVFIDQAGVDASQFSEGQLLDVTRKFKTKKSVKDDRTFYNNVVSATSVAVKARNEGSPQPAANSWTVVATPEDAPF